MVEFASGGKYVPHHPNQPEWSPESGYRDMYYDMMERADGFQMRYEQLRDLIFDDLLPLIRDEDFKVRVLADIEEIDLGIY